MSPAQYFAMALVMLTMGFHLGYRSRELRGHAPGSLFVGTYFLVWILLAFITVLNIGMEIARP
jgi:hypothetical protein